MTGFRLKRIYDPPELADGRRVLVDRLWPRGVSKAKAQLDEWLKEVSPSHDLRQRTHAGELDWEAFVAAYAAELAEEPTRSAADRLLELGRKETVTLLFAAHDETQNNAVALRRWLEQRLMD
jgi:uncharacterized protein YeaO (DUF488 family)